MNDDQAYLTDLSTVIYRLQQQHTLSNLEWDSLVINRRKPHTYRAWTYFDNIRVCLHRFETCSEEEAFYHPHPWPGAFYVLKGSYKMRVGHALARKSKPCHSLTTILNAGASYSITNPQTWHSVQPLEECWSVMINGQPFPENKKNIYAPTTQGKDLEKMTKEQLQSHLNTFQELLNV